jgi:hypothetical protein
MGHDTAVSQGQRFTRLLTDATTPRLSPDPLPISDVFDPWGSGRAI